jgi:lysozyme
MSYVQGCDVSSIQGSITNWDAIAAAGFQFVICKCGDGNNGIDPTYLNNINGANAAGLCVGTYHAIFPLPDAPGKINRNPVDQAKYHFTNTKTAINVADVEWPSENDWATWGCSASQINDWCLTYLETFASLQGGLPIVYTYPYYSQAVGFTSDITKFPLWAANYTSTPSAITPWTDWVLWQYSDQGKLPNGTLVDLDQARDLSLWGK